MEVTLDIAGDQINGARDYQEDAFLTTYLTDEDGDAKSAALVVVADGMGGHAAGNIASNLVVSTFNKTFTGKYGKQDPPSVLREALNNANGGLKESIKETPALEGMGCTMVTAAFSKGKVFWISVGDSHLYLIRDRAISKKNEDHSYGGYLDRMRSQGIDVEAEAGLSRNMLMSAMTGEEIAEIDCPKLGFQMLPGDRVIIASDGLDTLDEETILKTSAWSHTPTECVSGLLRAVDEAKRPRQDNTTVVVVDVKERKSAVAPPPDAAARGAQAPVVESRPELARERDVPAAAARSGGGMGAIVLVLVVLALGGGGVYAYMSGMLDGLLPAGGEPDKLAAGGESGGSSGSGVPAAPAGGSASTNVSGGTTTTAQPVTPEPPEPPTPKPAPSPPKVATRVETPRPEAPEQPPPASVPSTRREFRDALRSGGQGPLMVTVPAGKFTMGSPGHSVNADERPRRDVKVSAFAMSKFEVTYAEYERFARATGRAKPKSIDVDKATHPVVYVTWDDAFSYAQWLSKETGKRYRLPSESEWEYAASAGTDTTYWWGWEVGSNHAHCFDCNTGLNPRLPTSVGRFDANPFGLHDTAGNVSEWVQDCWHADYRGAPETGAVWEGGDCSHRVVRGGAYSNTSKSMRPQNRDKWKSQRATDTVGFRVVRDL